MKPFVDQIRERPLQFDGAVGSVLYQRGVFLNRSFDETTLSDPSLVLSVHRDYLAAGAHVITTNSYGANRVRLARHGLVDKVAELNREAVVLARRAGEAGSYYVAGSVGPTGAGVIAHLDAGRRVILEALSEQIEALAAAQVDLITLETFTHPEEMRLALEAAKARAPGVPVLAQMRFTPGRTLADGTEPEDVAASLRQWGADLIGVNCGEGPQLVFEVARRLLGAGLPVVAQPNAGRPEEVDGRAIYVTGPEYFGVYARRLLKAGISGVGGCCGTSPAHVRQMAGSVRMMAGGLDVEPVVEPGEASAPLQEPVPLAQRSDLGARIAAGQFVVSVEVNPPSGLDPSAQVEAARMLVAEGADIINTSDGPRASCRMSNLTMAELFQREVGCEVLLHVCCRDRNLLGLVGHLLGAHVAGIRNLVVITGDPPKLGDYPDATAVYDVDSIGLLRLIDRMNRGVDPGGNAMEPTSFLCATGVEPAAVDYDRELRRLRAKVEAGADVVMTQPVYDQSTLERLLADAEPLGVPILVGLLPLASYRNAEFLHHEVPGMAIPSHVRQRMKQAGHGKAARREGVKIAQEMLVAVKDRVAGAYVMPPLGRYRTAVEVMSVLGRGLRVPAAT